MAFKVTFFCTQQSTKTAGWTCNFWNTSADFAACKLRAEDLATYLNGIMGVGAVPVSIRMSEIGAFRRIEFSDLALPQLPLSATNDPDYPATALLLRLRTTTSALRYTTRQWIRGIPDSDVRSSGRFQPIATHIRNYNAFKAQLLLATNSWAMRVLVKTTPILDVDLITAAGVVTIPGHGYNALLVPRKVRISRAKNMAYANKVWRITNLTTDTFQLVGWDPPASLGTYQGGGKSQAQLYDEIAFNEAEFVRATSHKTGRPSNVLSGRRRARKT